MTALVTRPLTEHRARYAFRLATHADREARLIAANKLSGGSSGDTSAVPVEVPGTADTTVEVAS